MKSKPVILGGLADLYGLLWAGGVVSYLFLGGPPAGSAWTAPLFLATAAALVLALSPVREWSWLLGAAVFGFSVEALGVAVGFPFGHYSYTNVLFPHVFHVPVVMGAAWLVLFAYVRQMTTAPLTAAVWLTAIDGVIDPLAARVLHYWTWENSGLYYGIPWTNFAGWLAVSLVLFLAARKPAAPRPGVAALGLSVVLFFTVIAVGAGFFLAGLIGVGLVILHAARKLRVFRRSAPCTAEDPPDWPAR